MFRPYETFWSDDADNMLESYEFIKSIEMITYTLVIYSSNVTIKNQFVDTAFAYLEQAIKDDRFQDFMQNNENLLMQLGTRLHDMKSRNIQDGVLRAIEGKACPLYKEGVTQMARVLP